MTEVDGMHVSGGHCRDCGAVLDGRSHRHWCPSAQTRTLDVRPISGHPFEVQRDGIYPNVCIVCGEVADHPNHQLDVSAVSGDEVESNDLLPE